MKRWLLRILSGIIVFILLTLAVSHAYLKWQVSCMPGDTYSGTAPPPGVELVKMGERLRNDVENLSYDRSAYNPEGLKRAADHIVEEFEKLGVPPREQSYTLDREIVMETVRLRNQAGGKYDPYEIDDQVVTNYWIQIEGTQDPEELLIISAHYDTVRHSPGANDDASGMACVFEFARYFLQNPPKVSILLAAFTCEEYPVGVPATGGSDQFVDFILAERTAAGLPRPIGILSLDTLGNFSNEPGSQIYLFPLGNYYPEAGNFVAFVGDATSRDFVRQCVGMFRKVATIPSEGVAVPTRILKDVARSDHAPFIDRGVPGLMVTDTANFRIPNPYHSPEDTPDKIDFIKLARICEGLINCASKWE